MHVCDHLLLLLWGCSEQISLGRLRQQACICTVLAMLNLCRQVFMYAQALLSGSLFNFPNEREAQEEHRNCGLAHGVKAERDQ